MEPTPKQSSSFGRASSVDVSQLDKINAIPNKTKANILMDDLCPEDQLYLNTLMDNDLSELEDDENISCRSSAWSPMVQSPVMMKKRIKKLRPPYAVTLSLEDISYIRPSWGISKGMRTIEINRQKKTEPGLDKQVKKEKEEKSMPIYIVDRKKGHDKTQTNRILVSPSSKILEIYWPNGDTLDSILKVQFAQSIPEDLKPDECTCDIYLAESRRYDPNEILENKGNCFSCLDWAFRANLRVYVDRKMNDEMICYDIKWQSYDFLLTPLVDCFILGDEQWFGLGDVQAPLWPLNKLRFDWTSIVTNLTAEFPNNYSPNIASHQLPLGSYVNYSLFSTNGIYIGNIRTDFEVSFKISQDPKTGSKMSCLSVSCTDKCSQNWFRVDQLDRLRYHNNMLEYSICSASNLNTLVSRQLEDRIRATVYDVRNFGLNEVMITSNGTNSTLLENVIEKESKIDGLTSNDSSKLGLEPVSIETGETELPFGIGLIERTIFATSIEFMPVLDGQTLRHYVDNIVRLSLKTSPILLIDTRWETYVGSMKLNIAMFPKAKLLFEILHNKGFKIVFTIKPYIDTVIGVSNINQLFETGRLYTASYKKDTQMGKFGIQTRKENTCIKETLIRRRSLFTFQNQSTEIGLDDTVKSPYLFRCKESQEGYCVLLDMTLATNRAWIINCIKRSNLLTLEADGIQIGGAHPNNFYWDDHYRIGVTELVKSLIYKERIYTLPQWTGDFGYIQLAPRNCNWNELRSVINSVLNLGIVGFSLIHPGSVWGDVKPTKNSTQIESFKSSNRMDSIYGDMKANEKSDEELIIRWLQISVFLPILQFNNIVPLERYGLQELVQNLVKIRKAYIVPELKKNLPFTPLIIQSKSQSNRTQLPLIRPVWYSKENSEYAVTEQFTVGPDILVAPILSEGLRQRDIYLPNGFWHDELRNINIRGGKWLRNYPIELYEIAWFTRAKR